MTGTATPSPYWLAFGDIHDDLSRFASFPDLHGTSGVLVTGDMTLAGGAAQALRVLEPIARAVPALFAQIGNMDKHDVNNMLDEKDWNLHARARELFPGVYALGVGASPPTPFNTPSEYAEERLAEWMEEARAEAGCLAAAAGVNAPRLVLIAHAPPYASACDRLRSGAPVGSTAVRDFIEKYQPDICICGHIHESRAHDRIGTTEVINPGDFGSGGYAVLRYAEDTGLSAELRVLE